MRERKSKKKKSKGTNEQLMIQRLVCDTHTLEPEKEKKRREKK